MTEFFIVYISPNNATRTVALELQNRLSQDGRHVAMLDLAEPGAKGAFLEKLQASPEACLLIGSPVYRDMAVPPVMAFIDELPKKDKLWTVPFVTWGMACSGVALWQMANALIAKGCDLVGAAKVAAVHSMMLQTHAPAGAGHPDEEDKQIIRDLADSLLEKLTPLDPAVLNYQPHHLAEEFKAKLEKPWLIIPKTILEDACTQCGVCEEECPVAAVTLDPFPQFGNTCFDCFNCVRLCPEDAIQSSVPIKMIAEMILERVNNIAERPLTQIF